MTLHAGDERPGQAEPPLEGGDQPYPETVIAQANWIFARTMADTPHEYCLRKELGDADFDRFVRFIRDNGYRRKFRGRSYISLDVGEHYYWTMGWPMHQTILINRARFADDKPENHY